MTFDSFVRYLWIAALTVVLTASLYGIVVVTCSLPYRDVRFDPPLPVWEDVEWTVRDVPPQLLLHDHELRAEVLATVEAE